VRRAKQDRTGGIRFRREQHDMLLDAWEASGLGGPQFAARHGVDRTALRAPLAMARPGGLFGSTGG
jgi:hypothetical protein